MEFLFHTSILYTSKVHNAGYALKGDRKVIEPRYESHLNEKPFTYEAVLDFISIGNPFKNEFIDENRIRFCNKWGYLQGEKENGATFDVLLSDFQRNIEVREKLRFPDFILTLDFAWSRTREGKLIPIIKAQSLIHAMRTAFLLAQKKEVKTRECKREGCINLFEPGRSDQVFCTKSCKNKHTSNQSRKKKKYGVN